MTGTYAGHFIFHVAPNDFINKRYGKNDTPPPAELSPSSGCAPSDRPFDILGGPPPSPPPPPTPPPLSELSSPRATTRRDIGSPPTMSPMTNLLDSVKTLYAERMSPHLSRVPPEAVAFAILIAALVSTYLQHVRSSGGKSGRRGPPSDGAAALERRGRSDDAISRQMPPGSGAGGGGLKDPFDALRNRRRNESGGGGGGRIGGRGTGGGPAKIVPRRRQTLRVVVLLRAQRPERSGRVQGRAQDGGLRDERTEAAIQGGGGRGRRRTRGRRRRAGRGTPGIRRRGRRGRGRNGPRGGRRGFAADCLRCPPGSGGGGGAPLGRGGG